MTAFYGDPAVRAMIPALFAAGGNAVYCEDMSPPASAPLGADVYVYVVICATGGRITHLIVNGADGDGSNYCEGWILAE